MPHRIRSRLLAFLVLLALALTPAFAAAARQAHPARFMPKAAATSPASRVWSALLSLFARLGSEIDPDGAKAAKPAAPLTTSTSQPPTTTDLGAEMDPDG